MNRYRVYGFLDTPIEILGIPLNKALAFLIPFGFATSIGEMLYGIPAGIILAFIYGKLSGRKSFSVTARMLRWGVPGVKNTMPSPKTINEYRY